MEKEIYEIILSIPVESFWQNRESQITYSYFEYKGHEIIINHGHGNNQPLLIVDTIDIPTDDRFPSFLNKINEHWTSREATKRQEMMKNILDDFQSLITC